MFQATSEGAMRIERRKEERTMLTFQVPGEGNYDQGETNEREGSQETLLNSPICRHLEKGLLKVG